MNVEVALWLFDFECACKLKKWTELTHFFVQLGVDVKETCDCDCEDLVGDVGPEDCLGWLHENHRKFNSTVYEILDRNDCIQGIRMVLKRDLKSNCGCDWDENNEYGKIVLKSYGKNLLDNFLLKDKSKVTWI